MPDHYFNMLPKHFYAMVDGYMRREYKHSSELRKLGYLSIIPHVEKNKLNFQTFCQDFWPLQFDDEVFEKPESPLVGLTIEEQRAKFKEIMAIHNEKRYGDNNGVRKKR